MAGNHDTLISAELRSDRIKFSFKDDSDRIIQLGLTFDDTFALASLALLKLTEQGARQTPPVVPLLPVDRWKIEPVPNSDQMLFSYTLRDGARVGHMIHRDQAPDLMLAIAISAGLPIPEIPEGEQS